MEYEYIEAIYRKLDDEMLTKIYTYIDDKGGEIDQIDLENKYIKINIDTESETEVYLEINKLIKENISKKRSIFRDNPFIVAQAIQKDLGINYDEENKS